MAIQHLKYLIKDDSASDYVEKHSLLPSTEQTTVMMNPDGIYFRRFADYKQNQISIYPVNIEGTNTPAEDNYSGHENVDYALLNAISLAFKYNANNSDVSIRFWAHLPAYNGKIINIAFPVYVEDGVAKKATDTVRFHISGYTVFPGNILDVSRLLTQTFSAEIDLSFSENGEMDLISLEEIVLSDSVEMDCMLAIKITRVMMSDTPYLHSNVFVPYVNIQYNQEIIG